MSQTLTATDSEHITSGAEARRNIGRPPAALPWSADRQTGWCSCGCLTKFPYFDDPGCARHITDFGAYYRAGAAVRRLEDGRRYAA